MRGYYGGNEPWQPLIIIIVVVVFLMAIYGCERADITSNPKDNMYVCTFERIDGVFYASRRFAEGRNRMIKVYRFPMNDWHNRREFMFPRNKLEQCEYQKGE